MGEVGRKTSTGVCSRAGDRRGYRDQSGGPGEEEKIRKQPSWFSSRHGLWLIRGCLLGLSGKYVEGC